MVLTLKTTYLGNRNYYYCEDIYNVYPTFNPGNQAPNKVLKRHKLLKAHYTYARMVDGEWVHADGRSKKVDRLFISRRWFDANFAKNITNVIPKAPPIIDLENHEKFYDNDDNPIEIEVRGEREVGKCFFKVEDVAIGFDLPDLHRTIINKNTSYNENEHYKYFIVRYFFHSVEKKPIKKLFLTYNGILKVLYSSRGKNTGKFKTWACHTLFTAHLGLPEQKTRLANKLLSVNADSLINVLKSVPDPVSTIYFFILGSVETLRNKYNIPNEVDGKKILGKYGRSEDLIRRTKEHKKKYGTSIQILVFNIIDPTFVSKAENALDLFFKKDLVDITIKGNKETELVAVDESSIKMIKSQYSLVGTKYEGKVSKHAEIIKDLTNQHLDMIKDLNHAHEIALMEKNQEIIAERHQKELLEKDNLLLKKENQLLSQKIELLILKRNTNN